MRRALLVATSAVALSGLVACGSSSHPTATTASSPPATTRSTTSGTAPPMAGAALYVTLANGKVTPQHTNLDARVGETIIARVTSDATDQLQIRSTPVQTFQVVPGTNQPVKFTITTPGDVQVVFDKLNVPVATIHVHP